MTRILYWNIQQFSLNKIQDPNNLLSSMDRFDFILDVFLRINPDIFVIVEVTAAPGIAGGNNIEGRPSGQSRAALLLLLNEITFSALQPALPGYPGIGSGRIYNLVPPIDSGSQGFREGVAVFYNTNALQFIGPYVLQNDPYFNVSRSLAPGAGGVIANYHADWAPGFPGPVRNTPAGIPETQCAGQWSFYTLAGPRIAFPAAWGDQHQVNLNDVNDSILLHRSPFLTSFIDLTPGAGNRIIKLFSVHTSPGNAVAAVNQLATIQEIQANPNEVSVVVGDFNVNTFNVDRNGAYGGLCNTHEMHLDPRDVIAYTPAREPYCGTHLLPTNQATPYNATIGVGVDARRNVYPRFGYMGSSLINGGVMVMTAIDNIFTQYGGGAAVAPVNHNMTVVNPIVGSPYAAMGAGAPNGVLATTLINGLAYPVDLINPLPIAGAAAPGGYPAILPIPNYAPPALPPLGTDPTLIQFRQWNNYGKIRSTSDHLPLAIDV